MSCRPQSQCTKSTEQIFSDSVDNGVNKPESSAEVVRPHGHPETGTIIREQDEDSSCYFASSDIILQKYGIGYIFLLLDDCDNTKNLESIGYENNLSTPMRSSPRGSHFVDDVGARLVVEVVVLVHFKRQQKGVRKDRRRFNMSKRPDIF